MTRIERVATGPRISRPRFIAIGRIWFAGLVIPFCLASVSYGQATYQVVKGFEAPFLNGALPYAGVIQGTDGSFYGTTLQGGASGAGTVFKLDAAGTLTTLHSFTGGSDGANPHAGLIRATDGSFYGTTTYGGGASGVGTVFKLDAAGTLMTLHSFSSGSDGAYPYAGVIQATDRSFYGTTYTSDPTGVGTVFKLDAAGTLTTLHRFSRGSDGSFPYAGVIQATDGSFYGTTTWGGASDAGTVFKLDGAGTLTTLHSFTGDSDGAYPYAGVIQATDGSFYGTTTQGGASGVGTVFKLDPAGTLTTLHSFTNGSDSAYPYAGLIQATDGSFYGTTDGGGGASGGTVFKLDPAGTLTTLHSFTGGEGASPRAGVIQATDGSFYGTTPQGGASGVGTVFTLDGAGTLTTLHSFTGGDGASPYAGLIQATDGSFYGTTFGFGASDAGTVFTLDGAGTLTTLHSFTGSSDGGTPYAGVIQATDGSFYGTTFGFGASDAGTVFT
ncbi:MAG TPA: choice-of-anchor tandem repeat GloVer-containing protein, partial [Vicinamibacterales bacterium]